MADDFYFGGAGSKVGVMVQADFYDPDPDADDSAPTWASGVKLAAVDGWSFVARSDTKELYCMSSTQRLAAARYKYRVEGKLDFCKFDPTVASWWLMKALNSAGGGTVADTSKFTYFMIWGSLSAEGDGAILAAKVYNASFTTVPFGVSANEWTAVNLQFTASHADYLNTAPTFT